MARVQFVISDEERDRFVHQARVEGMTLSAWLRTAAHRRLEERERVKPLASPADLAEFFRQCDALEGPALEPDWSGIRDSHFTERVVMETNGQESEAVTTWTIADIGNLTIQGRQEAGTLVVKAAGRIDGANALKFQDALESPFDQNVTGLVLDLEHLSYISSAGLRVVLFAARQLEGRASKFVVCSLSDLVSEVFQVSGFDKIVPTYATQRDALSVLNG